MSIKKIGYVLVSFTLTITTGIFSAGPVFAQTGAVLRTNPATRNVSVGQNTSVDVQVNNVQNFGGYEFKLTFNPQVLQVTSTSTAVGNSFLASTGRTATPLTPIIDNVNGSVMVAVFTFGGANGPTVGSTFQELASVGFDVVGAGNTNIQFTTAILTDINGALISSTSQGTAVTVVGPTASPSPSVNPSASPSNPATMKIRFEGINEGRGNQTVSVIFKQGTTTTYNQNLVFEPDAANDGVYNYEFSAGTIAAGSYDIFIKGPIHLTTKIGYNFAPGTSLIDFSSGPLLAGDVLTNDEVDIFDYGQLVTDFGSRYPGSSPGDLDLDDDIDIFDYSYLVANFGKTGDQ